jgi:thioredoxin 1
MALEVTTETFEQEVVQSDKPVVVDFWGPRCGPCLALMPEVEMLSGKYAGRARITKVDASKNRRLCLNLKVTGLPTFLFFRGGQEVKRLNGSELKIGDVEAALQQMIE